MKTAIIVSLLILSLGAWLCIAMFHARSYMDAHGCDSVTMKWNFKTTCAPRRTGE